MQKQEKQQTTSSFPTPTPFQENNNTSLPKIISSPIVLPAPRVDNNTLGKITYQFSSSFLPNNAFVYKIKTYEIDTHTAEKIAQSFSLNSPPETSKDKDGNNISLWKNNDNTIYLTLDLTTGSIEYLYTSSPGKQDPAVHITPINAFSSLNEIISFSQDYLKNKNLFFPRNIMKEILFFSGQDEFIQVKNFSEATLFMVSFTTTLDEKQLYQQYGNIATTNLWIDKYKNVKKLTIQYPPFLEIPQNRLLINLEEAKTKLDHGDGIIVSYGTDEEVYDIKPIPQKTLFTKVDIGYFDDKKGIIQPIFVFSGKTTSSNGVQRDILVFLPAIKN